MSSRLAPGSAIAVRVPATSANLGPGFDCLALALGLFNDMTAEVLPEGRSTTVTITGEGASTLGNGDDNLAILAMELFARAHGDRLPPLRLCMHNDIPLSRGLGSSAAAIAGGLLTAAALLGLPCRPVDLLPVGLEMEGHPDNIVAALWGGCTLGVVDGGTAVVERIVPPGALRAVLLIPDAGSSTNESRAALPEAVSRADAVFNAGRVGLLVRALEQGRPDLLRVAMRDRLHQPYRALGFRYLEPAIEAALAAGAHGASLSGAGSSVIALATGDVDAIAAAFAGVADRYGVAARTCTLEIVPEGARFTPVERAG